MVPLEPAVTSCISSVSYIKPQQGIGNKRWCTVVYRPFPTSNHNLRLRYVVRLLVVYRPFPTSNHNSLNNCTNKAAVVYRPFPTSNHNHVLLQATWSLVVYRPFPTSNHNFEVMKLLGHVLYIVRFLHQTTTALLANSMLLSCISSVSYIKPQRSSTSTASRQVVYRPFPTSNHNYVLSPFWYR